MLLQIDLPRFEAALKGAQDRLRLAQAQKSNVEEAQGACSARSRNSIAQP